MQTQANNAQDAQNPNAMTWREARDSGLEVVGADVEASDEPWEG